MTKTAGTKTHSVASVFLILAVCACVFFSPGRAGAALQNEQILENRPVAAGLSLEKRKAFAGGSQVLIYTLRADLANPYLTINTLVGAAGTLNKNATVTNMAVGSGAVAAVNADFFQMAESGRPIGMTYRDKIMVTSPPLRSDMYAWAITNEGVPLIDVFSFSGSVTAANNARFPLAGVNKPSYFQSGGKNSHDGTLLMYNRLWGDTSRGKTGDNDQVTEVFTDGGKVTEIRVNQAGKAIPAGGYVLAGRGAAAEFIKKNIKVGDRITFEYTVAPQGENIRAGTGGWSLLVDKRRPMGNFPREIDGPNARTAIGYSSNKKMLYVVVVEKSAASRGLTLGELAEYMAGQGVERALNLDGGGSTTMAARPLGEDKPVLLNNPSRDVQRLVPTALAFFSSAPRSSLAGLAIKGPDAVFPGDSADLTVSGYDSNYNPYPLPREKIQWSLEGPGSLSGSVFTAGKSGNVLITASAEGLRATRSIQVLGPGSLKRIVAEPASITLKPGGSASVKVSAVGLDGTVYNLSPRNYTVSLDPVLGRFENGSYKAPAAPVSGTMKISLESLEAVVPIEVKEDPLPVIFKDMAGHWAAGAVSRLSAAGVVSGYPGNIFDPNRQVTRAEFVVMACKALGWKPDQGETAFRDANSIPAWSRGYVLTAVNKKIISGYEDGAFRPSSPVTRAEMAVIISRALSLSPSGSVMPAAVFTDGGKIPSWAAGAVSDVCAAGIMRGDKEKRFRPGDRATRAESAAVLDGAINHLKKRSSG